MTQYVAYYRVSTASQGRSGLGLAAQKARIAEYVGSGDEIIAEHVEVQSGKSDTREVLWKAIAVAKRHSAKVLIAKLDRFSAKSASSPGSWSRASASSLPTCPMRQTSSSTSLQLLPRRSVG